MREETRGCWVEPQNPTRRPESGEVLRVEAQAGRGCSDTARGGSVPALARVPPAPGSPNPRRALFLRQLLWEPCAPCCSVPCPSVPPLTVPSHDHPADCPPGLGTLGFPPRGRQGLRATSRHFPGKSVLGRAWERGASVGWRRAACGGESGWLEPRGDRGGAYKMCCALSARCHPPPLPRHFAQGQAGSVRAVPRPTTVFFLRPGSVALPARRRSLCPWRLGAPQTPRAGS